jgi:hypothetical protein
MTSTETSALVTGVDFVVTFFNDSEGNDLMLHHRYAPRHTDD